MSHPLSLPKVPRERLHCRAVTYDGFSREDGLFDIEAHLVDTKDHDFPLLTGVRPTGFPIHDMWARITIDETATIRDVEVVTDAMPYPGACDQVTPEYRKLIGANLLSGFRKHLHEVMGGVRGCTHITEMLANLPTAAIQMFAGLRRENQGDEKPFQLDRCHALETTTDTVRRYYPKWFRGNMTTGGAD